MRVEIRLYDAENETLSHGATITGFQHLLAHLQQAYDDIQYCSLTVRGHCEDNACRNDHLFFQLDLDDLRLALDGVETPSSTIGPQRPHQRPTKR